MWPLKCKPPLERVCLPRRHNHNILRYAHHGARAPSWIAGKIRLMENSVRLEALRVELQPRGASLRSVRGCNPVFSMRFGPLVEVGNGVTATHAFYPDVLDAG